MKPPRFSPPAGAALILLAALATPTPAPAGDITIKTPAELATALRDLKSGTTLKIAAGEYPGGHHVSGISKLTIEALDPAKPPVFKGGSGAWQFSRCPGLTLRHLTATGQRDNGFNLDDGGQLDQPVASITLEHLTVSDIGPSGNHNGIKCSGLRQVTIRDCLVTGWGGQGIDFVGCHEALITGCRLVGKPGFTASAGIQLKGGTTGVTIENCQFTNASDRPLNLGGSTGLAFFRPQGAKYEAARIIVRHNVIEGGQCAAAFVGVDGAEFSDNTIRHPTQWIFRILQETREPGFAPCRNVVVRGNRITFRRAQVRTELNIGPATAPETFRFERNHWFAEDQPAASRPHLPTPETAGVYGTNPEPR